MIGVAARTRRMIGVAARTRRMNAWTGNPSTLRLSFAAAVDE